MTGGVGHARLGTAALALSVRVAGARWLPDDEDAGVERSGSPRDPLAAIDEGWTARTAVDEDVATIGNGGSTDDSGRSADTDTASGLILKAIPIATRPCRLVPGNDRPR